MAEKRKLAQDWRNSYEYAQNKLKKVENQIKERLVELCRLHPKALIHKPKLRAEPLTAKDIHEDIDDYKTHDYLIFIDIIEKWLAAQHPHQQSEIKFDENEPKEYSEFIEYEDNGDEYKYPERKEVAEILDIRLYCMHEGCNKYIRGKEGYNGAFTAETGQRCDLRNQGFTCKEHRE